MSGTDIAVAALLAAVVLSAAVSAIGVLLAKDVYDRLQFSFGISAVGVWAMAAAVLVKESVSQAGIKSILIAIIVFFMNSVLTHATARAARIRRYGNLDIRPEEKANRARERDAA